MPPTLGMSKIERIGGLVARLIAGPRRLAGDRRGSVAPMLAFMLIPLVGSMALAGELSSWFMTNRSLQNAADSAAIAAATNNNTNFETGSGTVYNYQAEAYAVAASYGFVNGVNNVTVTVTTTTASPCPSGTTCYQVSIAKKVPLYLVQIVGYSGNTTLAGSNAQTLSALAIANPSSGTGGHFCVVALGSSGVTLTSNGGPDAQMTGCDIGSNGSMTCNGHDMGADAGYAVGTDGGSPGCGASKHSGASPIVDPYASLDTNIPPDPCGSSAASYPQEPKHGTLPASNLIGGSFTWTAGTTVLCGDQQLTGNVTVPPTTTKVVIFNGQLDTNSNSFTMNDGTLIFSSGGASGTSSGTAPPAGVSPTFSPTGGGAINITAPKSGTWSGIAIYQDPRTTSSYGTVDVAAAGNSPTWDVIGMNYFPNANFTIAGDVSSGAAGGACQGWVVNSMIIDGTGYIVDNNGCVAAGLTLPSAPGSRAVLVE